MKVSILWLFWLLALGSIFFVFYNTHLLLYEKKIENVEYQKLFSLDPIYRDIQKKNILRFEKINKLKRLIYTSFGFPNRVLVPQVVGISQKQGFTFWGGFSSFVFQREYSLLMQQTHHRFVDYIFTFLDLSSLAYYETDTKERFVAFTIQLQHGIFNSISTFFCIQNIEDIHSSLHSTWIFIKEPYHEEEIFLDFLNLKRIEKVSF